MSHENQIVSARSFQYDPNSVIRHTTVCQILKADRVHSTAPLIIEGSETNQIILLGNLGLRENNLNDKYTDFYLHDGTGRITVRVWKDDPMALDMSRLQLTTPYARVIGKADSWHKFKFVTAQKIEFTLNPYETYHHILQAIHDTVAYEKGHSECQPDLERTESIPNDSTRLLDSVPSSQLTSTHTLDSCVSDEYNNACVLQGKGKARLDDSVLGPRCLKSRGNFCESKHFKDGLGMSSSQFSPCVPTKLQYLDTHEPYSSLPSLDRKILYGICQEKNAGNQEGVYLPDIITAVSSICTFTEEEFMESLERLFEEGFIFSSIDDDHYDITPLACSLSKQ